jgi:hypothetical protein
VGPLRYVSQDAGGACSVRMAAWQHGSLAELWWCCAPVKVSARQVRSHPPAAASSPIAIARSPSAAPHGAPRLAGAGDGL